MPENLAPDLAVPSTSETIHGATRSACRVLTPPAKIASQWEGKLRARLNRAPLEAFLRGHSQFSSPKSPNHLLESLELACLFVIDPVVGHRTDWSALFHAEYFEVLGQAFARIGCALGQVVQEPAIWRVAALRAMGRLLTPTLGIDMAASIAAASIATFGFPRGGLQAFDETLEELTVSAVMRRSDEDLTAARELVGARLRSAVESGAARILTAPVMVTISAEPPSNH